jgi:hypothetical protein
MDAVRSDVDRRAELSLIALRKSHKEMEEVMGSWTITAKGCTYLPCRFNKKPVLFSC